MVLEAALEIQPYNTLLANSVVVALQQTSEQDDTLLLRSTVVVGQANPVIIEQNSWLAPP